MTVLSILVKKNFASPKINFEQLIYLSNKESFLLIWVGHGILW